MEIGHKRLVAVCQLGLDLTSLEIGGTTALAIDLSTDPLMRAFFHHIMKQGSEAKSVADFITRKPVLPSSITMACALFKGNRINLSYGQMEVRDAV